ncbi:MAG: fatty acid desaturase [Candidatus Eremiobacterota bacterium]
MPRSDFVRVEYDQPHFRRMRAILRDHPEVRRLFGTEPLTALWTVGLVGVQLGLGACLAERAWWLILLWAYLVGAVLNHSLWVVIHESCHRLVFRGTLPNRLVALLANLPQVVPGSMSFWKYHLLHHSWLGEQHGDADLALEEEAAWVGNSRLRKALMMFFFSFVQGVLRPSQIREVRLLDRWLVVNVICQAVFVGLFWSWAGPGGVAYLFLSMLFALGLHPLGGRWIAEHYLTHGEQETYSYYGPLNRLCFNMGYHNEHHDFVQVPWSRLPRLREMAPEYYEELYQHPSWPGVLMRFVWDPEVTLWDRIVRPRRKRQTEGTGTSQPDR